MSNRDNPFSQPSSPFNKKPAPKVSSTVPTPVKPTSNIPTPPPSTPVTPEPKPQLPVLPTFGTKTSGDIPVPTLPSFPKPAEFKPTSEQRSRGNIDTLFPEETTDENINYLEDEEETLEEVPTVTEAYKEMFGETLNPNISYENLTPEQEETTDKRLDAAQYPAALPTLYALAEDKDWIIRSFVASNESTPTSLLDRLAKDTESMVREAVMENENCSELTYRAFAYDTDDITVGNWIEHERTTSDMLVSLYDTKDAYIASVLLDSPKVPVNTKMVLKNKFQL